jgi:hypothetical protein
MQTLKILYQYAVINSNIPNKRGYYLSLLLIYILNAFSPNVCPVDLERHILNEFVGLFVWNNKFYAIYSRASKDNIH